MSLPFIGNFWAFSSIHDKNVTRISKKMKFLKFFLVGIIRIW
jgi:hypothetical protein